MVMLRAGCWLSGSTRGSMPTGTHVRHVGKPVCPGVAV
jgi:hypothetical protein